MRRSDGVLEKIACLFFSCKKAFGLQNSEKLKNGLNGTIYLFRVSNQREHGVTDCRVGYIIEDMHIVFKVC